MLAVDIGQEHHHHDDEEHHTRCREIGLERDKHHHGQHPPEHGHHPRLPMSQRCTGSTQEMGRMKDNGELCELGGLKVEWSKPDPPTRPFNLRTHDEHHQEETDTNKHGCR